MTKLDIQPVQATDLQNASNLNELIGKTGEAYLADPVYTLSDLELVQVGRFSWLEPAKLKSSDTEKKPNTKADLSDIIISDGGVFTQTWNVIEDIFSILVDFNDKHVYLDCLVDKEKRTYRRRKIELEILNGVVPIKRGQLVIIKQRRGKGKVYHEFENGTSIIPEKYFDYQDSFDDMKDIFFGKKL